MCVYVCVFIFAQLWLFWILCIYIDRPAEYTITCALHAQFPYANSASCIIFHLCEEGGKDGQCHCGIWCANLCCK